MGVADDETVFLEMLLIEEGGLMQVVLVEPAISNGAITADLDAQLMDERFGSEAIGIRSGDGHGAAIADICSPGVLKLIALGVAAEVVVIIKNEDSLFGPQGVR